MSDEQEILGKFQSLDLGPNDIVVIICPFQISVKYADNLKEAWHSAGLKNKVVVIDNGGEIGVLRQGASDENYE